MEYLKRVIGPNASFEPAAIVKAREATTKARELCRLDNMAVGYNSFSFRILLGARGRLWIKVLFPLPAPDYNTANTPNGAWA